LSGGHKKGSRHQRGERTHAAQSTAFNASCRYARSSRGNATGYTPV
jgi:hypothetical protein